MDDPLTKNPSPQSDLSRRLASVLGPDLKSCKDRNCCCELKQLRRGTAVSVSGCPDAKYQPLIYICPFELMSNMAHIPV